MVSSEQEPTIKKSLRSDEPICHADDDGLARGPLVEVIARHILATRAPESIVIGLNAPWGAGKSSFLNLLEAKLVPTAHKGNSDDRDAALSIVRLNPWHYGSIDQLVRIFFAELTRAISASANRKLAKKIGEALHAVGSLVSVFHSGAGDLMKEGGGKLTTEKSLPTLKSELGALLRELGHPIIVFIDDIDRVERKVLRLLFRMVRINADFPNVTYVLAFDRSVVEKNLDEKNGVCGRDYLEKIIQVSFDIPEPEQGTLDRILFSELDAVLTSQETRPLDSHRWVNTFHSGFREHFWTIRRIKRYANGLRLTLPLVALEVDIVDFLAVELIRTFHPEVYQAIARSKSLLTGRSRTGVDTEALRSWLGNVRSQASENGGDLVAKLAKQLFPKLAAVDEHPMLARGTDENRRKNGRVCSAEIFDKFFLLAVPTGNLSEQEMASFVRGLEDPDESAKALCHIRESDRTRHFLERLRDFVDDLPLDELKNLIRILFDQGDDLHFKSRGVLDLQADMLLQSVVYACLQRVGEEEDERYKFLLELTGSGALYTVVQRVHFSAPKDDGSEPRLISDRGLWERLRDAAVERLVAANESGALWLHPHLSFLLYAWEEWGDADEARKAVGVYIEPDAHLVPFVSRFVSESHSFTLGDVAQRTHQKISWRGIAKFVDTDAVALRLRAIASTEGSLAGAAAELVALFESTGHPWEGVTRRDDTG